MSSAAAYISLFLSALIAATLVPTQSETILSGLLLTEKYNPWLLVAIASIGNTLGSVINWELGIGIKRFRDKSWFPVTPSALQHAQGWYQRYGYWSLLLSWVPFIGDPITVAAGVMREKLIVFLPIVAFAKTIRYVVLAVLLI